MREKFQRLAIFCGASTGNRPVDSEAARETGRFLAQQNIGVVFGGGHIGMMGAVADAALAAGGEVIGVIPEALMEREMAHQQLSELIVVPDMHTRKAKMAALADGFIALPGGIGTLEEIFEVWTWHVLGYHRKPVGFLNVDGFYDSLLDFLDQLVVTGFLQPRFRDLVSVAEVMEKLCVKMAAGSAGGEQC